MNSRKGGHKTHHLDVLKHKLFRRLDVLLLPHMGHVAPVVRPVAPVRRPARVVDEAPHALAAQHPVQIIRDAAARGRVPVALVRGPRRRRRPEQRGEHDGRPAGEGVGEHGPGHRGEHDEGQRHERQAGRAPRREEPEDVGCPHRRRASQVCMELVSPQTQLSKKKKNLLPALIESSTRRERKRIQEKEKITFFMD